MGIVDIIVGVLTGIGGNYCYANLTKDNIERKIKECYDKAENDFYIEYGDSYGNDISSFLTREENVQEVIKRLLFTGKEISSESFNTNEWEQGIRTPVEVVNFFIDKLKLYFSEDLELNNLIRQNNNYNLQEEIYKIVKELKEANQNDQINQGVVSKEERKLVSEFIESIYTLEKLFKENFKIEFLRSNLNLQENQLICKNDEKESLELIFLRLNKFIELFNIDAMNRISGINLEDPIESINLFLKSKYHEESYYIDIDVIKKLRSVYEIVMSNINGKNARYYKSIEFLDIKDNMSNREISLRIISTLFKVIEEIIRIIVRKNTKNENEFYSTLAIEKVRSRKKHNTKNLLNTYPRVIKYLNVMSSVDSIIDTELANQISVDIDTLRKEMYPALGHVFYYKYNSFDSTQIYILEELKDIVKELI